MFSKAKASSESPSRAVNYFRHFPTSFLKPYGVADGPLLEDTVLRRISSINCEWLRRPQTAASEFSETIEKNLTLLSDHDSIFLKKNKFAAIREKLQAFLEVLAKLNTKNTEEVPAPADIKRFLQTMLQENEEIDNFFQEMFQYGGAMYLLGVHYCSIKALLSNPDTYAEKCLDTFSNELKRFKSDPTIKGMKTMLTKACCNESQASGSHAPKKATKRNLVELLDSDDETESHDEPQEDEVRPPTNQKKKSKKTKKEKK